MAFQTYMDLKNLGHHIYVALPTRYNRSI